MYGMSDLTKLAIFALQYACALIGALIAVQLVVLASGDEISPSDQTPTATERHETWGPGRSVVYWRSPPGRIQDQLYEVPTVRAR